MRRNSYSKMAFLHSLKPHLDKFDEDDFLEFQMAVLKIINNINDKKKTRFAHSAPFPSMPIRMLFHQKLSAPLPSSQHYDGPSALNISSQPVSPISTRDSQFHTSQLPSRPSITGKYSIAQYYQNFGTCTTAEKETVYSSSTTSTVSSADESIDFCSSK